MSLLFLCITEVHYHDDKGNKEATEYVKNNGFNPVWNQTFSFNVKVPALAFLDFRVKDHSKSGKDQSLGAFSCPLSMVLPGTALFMILY